MMPWHVIKKPKEVANGEHHSKLKEVVPVPVGEHPVAEYCCWEVSQPFTINAWWPVDPRLLGRRSSGCGVDRGWTTAPDLCRVWRSLADPIHPSRVGLWCRSIPPQSAIGSLSLPRQLSVGEPWLRGQCQMVPPPIWWEEVRQPQ